MSEDNGADDVVTRYQHAGTYHRNINPGQPSKKSKEILALYQVNVDPGKFKNNGSLLFWPQLI